jgi:hypothetical protein
VTAGLAAFLSVGAAGAQERGSGLWNFRLGASFGVRSDDNIISLSEQDQDFLNSFPEAGKERFGIDSVADWVFLPGLIVGFDREPRKGRDTGISFAVRGHQYERNPVKNYTELALTFRQELNRSRAHGTLLTVAVGYIPEYFVRRLIDDDESDPVSGTIVRNDLDYQLTRAILTIAQEVVPRVFGFEVGYTRALRDYNDHFNERDSTSDALALECNVYPLRRIGFLIRPYYARETRDTAGDVRVSLAVVEDDVGYDSNLYGLSLRGIWGRDGDHQNIFNVFYEREARNYTTQNLADPGHLGREDAISKYALSYEREFGPAWALLISGYHRVNEVSFPDGRSTPYPKSVVTATVGYRFRRPM